VWIQQGVRKKLQRIEVPPGEKPVLGVCFAIAALIGLVILEVAHVAYLGSWSSERCLGMTSPRCPRQALALQYRKQHLTIRFTQSLRLRETG